MANANEEEEVLDGKHVRMYYVLFIFFYLTLHKFGFDHKLNFIHVFPIFNCLCPFATTNILGLWQNDSL